MTESEQQRFQVLVNQEEQYGLHPADQPVPGGWTATGMTGTEDECSGWVDEHWTDLRPLSARTGTPPATTEATR